MTTARIELANKFRNGRCVGNLYGVALVVDGRRAGWLLVPQPDETIAREFAAQYAPVLA